MDLGAKYYNSENLFNSYYTDDNLDILLNSDLGDLAREQDDNWWEVVMKGNDDYEFSGFTLKKRSN